MIGGTHILGADNPNVPGVSYVNDDRTFLQNFALR